MTQKRSLKGVSSKGEDLGSAAEKEEIGGPCPLRGGKCEENFRHGDERQRAGPVFSSFGRKERKGG